VRAFLCLFGDDTLGVVLYLVDSQSVVIRINEKKIIVHYPKALIHIIERHPPLFKAVSCKRLGLYFFGKLRKPTACRLKPLSSMMNAHRPVRIITLSMLIIRWKPTFKKIQPRAKR
jgi:hypothetical protein